MPETHSLDNTVAAVIDSPEESEAAIDELRKAGFEFEVLRGEEGQEHLDPEGEEGLWATLKRMATALGDENRVLKRLDKELASGNTVISIDIGNGDSSEAIKILREHGGRYIWKFGDWAFTPIEV